MRCLAQKYSKRNTQEDTSFLSPWGAMLTWPTRGSINVESSLLISKRIFKMREQLYFLAGEAVRDACAASASITAEPSY